MITSTGGLQNRCGVAAPRSVGSTPAPLRQPQTAWVKAFRAVLRGTLGNTPSVLTSGDRLGRAHAGTARAREVQVRRRWPMRASPLSAATKKLDLLPNR